jgi:tRNA (guanine26-N2/guanine27-N2)-dimethyltransferase
MPPGWLDRPGARLLAALLADPGEPARCWPLAEIARRLGGGPPRLADLVKVLRGEGFQACASGVRAGELRSDAPWTLILSQAAALTR